MIVMDPGMFRLMIGNLFVILVSIWNYYHWKKYLIRIGGHWRRHTLENVHVFKWFFSLILALIFFTSIVLALADIHWGKKPVRDDRVNVDIAIAFDVSQSMLADDVYPSRLARSMEVAGRVINELQGYRFSFTVFKGSAVTIVPMTDDKNHIRSFIPHLYPSMLSSRGSNLETALTRAYESFDANINRKKILLLFSDGESLDGTPVKAAKQALVNNVPVFTIAAGTSGGSTIRLSDGSLVQNEAGNAVKTKANIPLLKKISSITGGVFTDSTKVYAIEAMLDKLKSEAEYEKQTGVLFVSVPRYRLFVLIAFVSVLVLITIRKIRWKDAY